MEVYPYILNFHSFNVNEILHCRFLLCWGGSDWCDRPLCPRVLLCGWFRQWFPWNLSTRQILSRRWEQLHYFSCISSVKEEVFHFQRILKIYVYLIKYRPGPGCSKLTTSLVNVSLKFQTLISQAYIFCWKNVWSFALQKSFQYLSTL